MFNDLNNLANLIERASLDSAFTRSACDALRKTADDIAKSLANMTTTTTTTDSTEAVKVFTVHYCEPRPKGFDNLHDYHKIFVEEVVENYHYSVKVMTKPDFPEEIDLAFIKVDGFNSAYELMYNFDGFDHFRIEGDHDSGEAWVNYSDFTLVMKWGGNES